MRLTRAQIGAMLRPLAPAGAVVSAMPLSGGLANTSYRVRLRGRPDPLVLRLYVRDPAACRREEAVLRLVRGRVPAPEMLLVQPDASAHGWPFAVMNWVDGVPMGMALAAGEQVAAIGAATGAVLATIGGYRFEQSGFLGAGLALERPLSWPEALVGEVERCLWRAPGGQRLGIEAAEQAWRLLQANRGVLTELPDQASLVHADYKASNLVLRRAGQGWAVAGVLDWEFVISGPPLLDVAIMLRAQALDGAFAQAFVAAFRDGGGSLPDRWRQSVRLLDLVNLCQFLAAEPERPAVTPLARALVLRTLAEWPSLAA